MDTKEDESPSFIQSIKKVLSKGADNVKKTQTYSHHNPTVYALYSLFYVFCFR